MDAFKLTTLVLSLTQIRNNKLQVKALVTIRIQVNHNSQQ